MITKRSIETSNMFKIIYIYIYIYIYIKIESGDISKKKNIIFQK